MMAGVLAWIFLMSGVFVGVFNRAGVLGGVLLRVVSDFVCLVGNGDIFF